MSIFNKKEIIIKEVKVEPTFEEALAIVSSQFATPSQLRIDSTLEATVFEDMSAIKNILEFLKDTMSSDMHRFFNAPPEEQQLARGAFMRTSYFYDQVKGMIDMKKNT